MEGKIRIHIYLDAMLHSDFYERLADHILEHGWPAAGGGVINLYPEIPRDQNGWEITALGQASPHSAGIS